jgi:hypothetical protein
MCPHTKPAYANNAPYGFAGTSYPTQKNTKKNTKKNLRALGGAVRIGRDHENNRYKKIKGRECMHARYADT